MDRLTYLLIIGFATRAFSSFNIVLIIADDLDSELDGMTPLNQTRKLIGDQGSTYSNCFVASPICCPNRASILTGRYQHNHRTVNNSIEGGCSSHDWQQTMEPNSFAAILKAKTNYQTFYSGKYLNQYGFARSGGVRRVPPGWDYWAGLVGNSKYYDYSLSINGTAKKYSNKPDHYLTDVIKKMATSFINARRTNDGPFLMVLAPPAPHAPFTPASRHSGQYKDTTAKKTPSFNTPRQKDKHWFVRMGESPLSKSTLARLDETYRRRWETLVAVDELVSEVYRSLTKSSLLNNTYIIFTSDNGYHIGQFSMPIDKRQPYETDIKVPLLIRGPGIPVSNVNAPVSSVDLFDTILKIAGVEQPSDGQSVLKWDLPPDRDVLVEYRGEQSDSKTPTGCSTDSDPNLAHCNKALSCKCEDSKNNTYACVRRVSAKHNNIFCVFEDTEQYVEAYDFQEDQYQLHNIGLTMKRGRRNKFRRRLKKLVQCRGQNCLQIGQNT